MSLDLRALIDTAITARGAGAETALARAVAERLGNAGRWENLRSQINRYRKGKRADGYAATLPLHVAEIILDELRLDVVPRA